MFFLAVVAIAILLLAANREHRANQAMAIAAYRMAVADEQSTHARALSEEARAFVAEEKKRLADYLNMVGSVTATSPNEDVAASGRDLVMRAQALGIRRVK